MASTSDSNRAAPWTAAVARLPWWACIALAVVFHAALHAVARLPQVIVVDPYPVGPDLARLVLLGLADHLQYILPVVCICGLALVRCIARADALAADEGNGVSAREYERLTGRGLRLRDCV